MPDFIESVKFIVLHSKPLAVSNLLFSFAYQGQTKKKVCFHIILTLMIRPNQILIIQCVQMLVTPNYVRKAKDIPC